MATTHTADRDRHNKRSDRRNLLVSLGIAAAASLVGFAVLLVQRVVPVPPDSTAPASKSNESARRELAATTSDSSSHFDARLTAARRLRGETDDGHDSEAEASRVREGAESPIESQDSSEAAGDKNDAAPKEETPRRLLKKMRRQVADGNGDAALETSRRIATTLADPDDRSALRGRIDDAAAASAAGQVIDFTSLIDLIRNTIAPNTWDSSGGPGGMREFPGGVYVDTNGLVRPRVTSDAGAELARVRDAARAAAGPSGAAPPVGRSDIRMISLPRLEREIARRIAAGEPLPEDVRFLAGLTQVQYVLVYPDEHDVVIAGPAENWRRDELGRGVGTDSGRPVLQLDDLVVILRACFAESERRGVFGCGIYPRAERLAAVQEFLNASAQRPIEPNQRDRWLADLRDQLGEQDIDVFGVPAGSRVAHVLVEADYRMKLVGIGLERAAVAGIPSYFELFGQPTPERLERGLDTLRWWFAMNYDAVVATPAADAFELRGGRVKVLSENELLTATGQVIHTGQSDPVNEQFARNFTERFPSLAGRDANFADLAGIFDLAVLAGLLSGEAIPQRVGWPMTTLLNPDEYLVPLQPAPRTVESVINHRVYRDRHIIAVVSGGVMVNPWKVVDREKRQLESNDRLRDRRAAASSARDAARWWWE